MGFFSDFVAGAATSASGEIGRRQAEQTKISDEQRQQELAIERERVVSKMKADMAEQAVQAKRTRTNEQMTAVEAAAPEATRARQLAEMQARAPSATADTMDIVRQRLGAGDVEKHYGVQDNVVSRLGDKLGIARQGGYAEAEDQLSAAYKETVAQLKMQNDEADRVRKDETANKRIDTTAATAAAGQAAMLERMAIQGQNQLAAINARGSGSGGSGGSASESRVLSAMNQIEGQILKKEKAIRDANEISLADASNPAKAEAHRKKVDSLIANDEGIKKQRAHLSQLEKRVFTDLVPEEKPSDSAPAPASKAPPAAQDVIVAGVKIGSASSPEQAKALVQQHLASQQQKAPAPAPQVAPTRGGATARPAPQAPTPQPAPAPRDDRIRLPASDSPLASKPGMLARMREQERLNPTRLRPMTPEEASTLDKLDAFMQSAVSRK